MTSNSPTDAVILAWLGEGPTGLTAPERRAIADAAEVAGQRHRAFPMWLPRTGRVVALVAATVALVLAVSALVSSGWPTPTPSAMPSPSPTGATVPSPSARSGQAGCEPEMPVRDVQWTGRVRTDLAGMPVVCSLSDRADTAFEGIDIRAVRMDHVEQPQYRLPLAAFPPPASTLDPEVIIEYGFVFETTGDDVPDYVVGINNDAPDGFRVWVTALATNTTKEQVGGPYGFPVEFSHPSEVAGDEGRPPEMMFTFLGGSQPWASTSARGLRFYAWSSVTSGTDVIAWDYAPDYGWSGDAHAGVPNQDLGQAFDLPYPAALWEQAAVSQVTRTPETIRLPAAGVPGLWAWTDEAAEATTGSDSRIDLLDIEFSRDCSFTPLLCVEFMSKVPLREPLLWPYADWLAYGLDVDGDGDGDADLRLGMDNGMLGHRGWFVDLATGEISQAATAEGHSIGVQGLGETAYPWLPETGEATPGRLWLGRETALWQEGAARFYLWSAVVREGELAGFDFAPNDGWLAIPPLSQ